MAAYGTASLNAPVRFAFRAFQPSNADLSSFSLTCPPTRQTTIEKARNEVRFTVYAIQSGAAALLKSVTLLPPCSNQPHFTPTVELDYVVDGSAIQINEGPAQGSGPALTLTLKGNGPNTYPWKVLNLNGSTYAVSVLPEVDKFGPNNGISGGMWQQGDTVLTLNTESSVPCPGRAECRYNPGITLETFTYIVQHMKAVGQAGGP